MKIKLINIISYFILPLFFFGCATPPYKIRSAYVSPTQYSGYSCKQINMELVRVNRKIMEITRQAPKGASRNADLAILKGEYEALETASILKECETPKELLQARMRREKQALKSESFSDSPLKQTVAILPWKLTGEAYPRNFVAISALKQLLSDNESFVPTHSYYGLGYEFYKTQKISKNLMNNKTIADLWSKIDTSFNSIPDLELACKIGRQLKVDTIMMCNIHVGNEDPPAAWFVVYLIDVKTKSAIFDADMTPDFEGRGYDTFKKLFERVFTNYSS